MLTGYRTYITIAVMVFHQVLNYFGFADFTGEEVSAIIDGVLGIVAIYFRKKANSDGSTPQK
jgi:ammonia channel protein AmtB